MEEDEEEEKEEDEEEVKGEGLIRCSRHTSAYVRTGLGNSEVE